MTDVLYAWPDATRFGRRIPKDTIYAHASVSPAVKAAFVEHVDQIIWGHKIAPATVRVPATEAVPEIQVIEVRAKGEDVPDHVLAAVDRAIPLPVIFEVTRPHTSGGLVRMQAAYRPVGVGGAGGAASTGWMADDAPRTPLPAALDLTQLYGALLSPLLGVRIEPGDAPEAIADRLARRSALEREHAALSRQCRAEKQFNRRVNLRATLTAIEKEMESLT